MKSVGLITFHFPINYGAVLQTYALYSFLKRRGYDIELINYYSDKRMSGYDFYHKPNSLKEILFYIVKTLFIGDYLLKRKKFRRFLIGHFNLTPRYKDVESISFHYDYVITGSDQVFNFDNPETMAYFQPFEKKEFQKKIAYAPSFGRSEFANEWKERIQKYVKDFDALSCRENDGATFLSEIIGKQITQVLDPVFLLDKEAWSSICSKRLIKEDYIFIYDLGGNKSLIDIAKVLNKNRCKIVVISDNPISKISKYYQGVDIFYNSAGLEDFLSLIKYSTAVVTDAFHGTAFSIIFQKPFYTYIAFEKAATRITSLLSNLSMQDRIIVHGDSLDTIKGMDKLPDFARLNEQIIKSESYLIRSLHE